MSSPNDVVPSNLEVDYDKNITHLYKAITQSKWDDAIRAAKTSPEEARTWVVRHYEDGGDGQKEIMWRFLPVHSACARQPPASLITALLEAYPDGAKCVDDQGMYALHYACGNQASREVIRLLLMAFPHAAKMKDPRGMLPIHYIACWGPSSISVVDMVLVANRDVADARDEDGNSPLDLAKEGEYPERDAVVAALRRWLDSSVDVSTRSNALRSAPTEEKKQEESDYGSPRSLGRDMKLTRKNLDTTEWENQRYYSSTRSYNGQQDTYAGRMTQLEERINELENEAKFNKHNVAELRNQLRKKDFELEETRQFFEKACDERDGLRQTLADLTDQHDKFKKRSEILSDRLGSMNASLLTMMEQQDVVLSAMKAREEQWQSLSDLRREKLKELVGLEEQETCEEVELRTCLMKQSKEMEAIKAVIAAVRQADDFY